MWLKDILFIMSTLIYFISCTDEKQTIKLLVESYQRLGLEGRPVANASTPVDVTVGFALIQIITVDQLNQHITLTGRTYMSWKDPVLATDELQSDFSIPPSKVWTPDISILNVIEEPRDLDNTNLFVSPSGDVKWIRPQRLTLTCSTEPDDTEPLCDIIFSSFSHSLAQLTLTSAENRIEAGQYVSSNVWELSKTKATVGERTHHFDKEKKFADLTFNFALKKRPQKDDDKDKEKKDGASGLQSSILLLLVTACFTIHQLVRL